MTHPMGTPDQAAATRSVPASLLTRSSWLTRAATLLLHPLLMPVYCALLTLYGWTPYSHLAGPIAVRVMLNVCLYSCAAPLATLGCFMLWGGVGSLEMPTRRERVWPLLVMGGLVASALLVLNTGNTPRPLVGMMASEALGLLLIGLLALRWKVSLHAFGAGALMAFTVLVGVAYGGDFAVEAGLAFAVGGVGAWARLCEGAHNPEELLAGYLIGVGLTGALMLLTLTHILF